MVQGAGPREDASLCIGRNAGLSSIPKVEPHDDDEQQQQGCPLVGGESVVLRGSEAAA